MGSGSGSAIRKNAGTGSVCGSTTLQKRKAVSSSLPSVNLLVTVIGPKWSLGLFYLHKSVILNTERLHLNIE
jgi:hypothetical protein